MNIFKFFFVLTNLQEKTPWTTLTTSSCVLLILNRWEELVYLMLAPTMNLFFGESYSNTYNIQPVKKINTTHCHTS